MSLISLGSSVVLLERQRTAIRVVVATAIGAGNITVSAKLLFSEVPPRPLARAIVLITVSVPAPQVPMSISNSYWVAVASSLKLIPTRYSASAVLAITCDQAPFVHATPEFAGLMPAAAEG